MAVYVPGIGPVSIVERKALDEIRRLMKDKHTTQSNECFSPLFNWGPKQETVTKSVEPGETANQCLDSCFPRL